MFELKRFKLLRFDYNIVNHIVIDKRCIYKIYVNSFMFTFLVIV